MIYCKAYHVSWIIHWKWPITSNLRSSENALAYMLAADEGVIKATYCKFLPRWFRFGLSSSFTWSASQYSEGLNFDWLMVGNVGLWPAKTFVWTRVTEDLRNGGPLEMLSIAKPIKIKVLLHQFYQTAALQAFGRCRTIISHRGPKGAKRENKKTTTKEKTRRCRSFLSGMLLPCTSRSRGRY